MRRLLACSVMSVVTIVVPTAQLQTPADWIWRTDTPSKVTATTPMPKDSWYFVAMPPGWHVTTGPGTIIHHPAHGAKGLYSLELEVHLFPGTSQSEYGLLAGGRGLEAASASPEYIAFVGRRDGQSAILRYTAKGPAPIRDWTASPAVLPHPGGEGTVKNIFRVDVTMQEVVFSANGKEIVKLPKTGLALDGLIGLRAGPDLNLHITRLDVTHKLAPAK